ncbi:holo-ACP synthase [Gemella sp. zg-1178]|uniref:holo-ACP synthase n=1 Tax=Gemella sp. zg-1178 TaxID=2840372 RepID=UPI001C04BE48|nr:holo-ACP synthase [Gemella sp. zg-1178]MBU0278320.1 holo-ACP synthase [Gemella sp. zg-1178]
MIYGIGTDIESIERFYEFFDKKNYIEKIYTQSEIEEFNSINNSRRKAEFLASRYAVKEAMSKALGVGISKYFSFKDVEVKKDILGKPMIEYKNFVVHLTISHNKDNVVAFVLLEKEDE